jgi:hypothetical protein
MVNKDGGSSTNEWCDYVLAWQYGTNNEYRLVIVVIVTHTCCMMPT